MQLPYNSPGGWLVHVLYSQCVYFPINGPGWPFGKPGTISRKFKICWLVFVLAWLVVPNLTASMNNPFFSAFSISTMIYFAVVLTSWQMFLLKQYCILHHIWILSNCFICKSNSTFFKKLFVCKMFQKN